MMTVLGRFTAGDGGYAGAIRTVTLDKPLRLAPTGADHEKAPSHRAFTEGEVECGAAWPANDENAVLFVRLDDPAWPAPLRARLVRAREGGDYLLVWRRPPPD